MKKYLGNKIHPHKSTRMDKVHRKEELNFKNQKNPLITTFSKLNRKIEANMKMIGLNALRP